MTTTTVYRAPSYTYYAPATYHAPIIVSTYVPAPSYYVYYSYNAAYGIQDRHEEVRRSSGVVTFIIILILIICILICICG